MLLRRPTGMRAFTLVWAGQVISLLGTGMTAFALAVWAFELTGQVTSLALVSFFATAPVLLVSPIAGVFVDRWNRRLVMALSDGVAALSTLAVLLLYNTGQLEIWHLYIAGAIAGIGQAFQWPAYSAAISTMLRKDQYARADGMLGLAGASSEILAPVLAGVLLAVIGIPGILTFDLISFVLAVVTLLLVVIPQPERSAAGREAEGSVWKEALYGFRYIRQRPSLVGMLKVFLAAGFFFSLAYLALTPMILARTGNNEQTLGLVQSVGALGGVVGGLYMSLKGGPRRKIHGFLGSFIITGLLSTTGLALGRSIYVWMAAIFCDTLVSPVMMGTQQAIWQAKVPPDVQGRVFAARRLVGEFSNPIALLIGGPLVDKFFEPAMQSGGALAPVFGPLVGIGPGAGMALMLLIFGFCGLASGVGGYLSPAVRNVETLLPDHDTPESETALGATS